MEILTMHGFEKNLIEAKLSKQHLTISQSTRTPGAPLESTHFVLTISGKIFQNETPIDIRFLHQDWGNPKKAPTIGLQETSTIGLIYLVDQYVAFDHLKLIQDNVSAGTIASAKIEYVGEKFPDRPANGFEQRNIIQIILP